MRTRLVGAFGFRISQYTRILAAVGWAGGSFDTIFLPSQSKKSLALHSNQKAHMKPIKRRD